MTSAAKKCFQENLDLFIEHTKIKKGPIFDLEVQLPTLELNPKNEAYIRHYLFQKWQDRWKGVRRRHIKDKDDTRYTRNPYAADLSGGCRLAAMFSSLIFPFDDGRMWCNSKHAFVVLGNGSIYDMNRHCHDAVNFLIKNPAKAYACDSAYFDEAMKKSLPSWHAILADWLADFLPVIKENRLILSSKRIKTLPAWSALPDFSTKNQQIDEK